MSLQQYFDRRTKQIKTSSRVDKHIFAAAWQQRFGTDQMNYEEEWRIATELRLRSYYRQIVELRIQSIVAMILLVFLLVKPPELNLMTAWKYVRGYLNPEKVYAANPPPPQALKTDAWDIIQSACQQENCPDPGLIYAQWSTETSVVDCSPYRDQAEPSPCKSKAGAMGPCQFMPGTWPIYAESGWDIWSLPDCARAASRMDKVLMLWDQPSREVFAKRFSGQDGGLAWNLGEDGYGQALQVWDIWVSIGKRYTFSVSAQDPSLGYQYNVINFFAWKSGAKVGDDFAGAVTIQPHETLDVNAYFGPYSWVQGMKRVSGIEGFGGCNSASMMHYVAAMSGLKVQATDLTHPSVAGVPQGYWTWIWTEAGNLKNLWITNDGDQSATIHWQIQGDSITLWVTRP